MPKQKKQLTVVAVRLPQEEVEMLKRRAAEEGFTSLSGLVRTSLRGLIGTYKAEQQSQVVQLMANMQQLEERLRRLEGEEADERPVRPNGHAVAE